MDLKIRKRAAHPLATWPITYETEVYEERGRVKRDVCLLRVSVIPQLAHYLLQVWMTGDERKSLDQYEFQNCVIEHMIDVQHLLQLYHQPGGGLDPPPLHPSPL